MAKVEMYNSDLCPFCYRARALLEQKGVTVELYSVDGNDQRHREMSQRTGRTSVPQIFIDDEHIGGCDDLYALERAAGLDAKLGLA
jgi:glutaredoxin 3